MGFVESIRRSNSEHAQTHRHHASLMSAIQQQQQRRQTSNQLFNEASLLFICYVDKAFHVKVNSLFFH